MTATRTTDRRAARHEATKARILDAAWDLAREQGLAGISLRDLAARVDLRQPSLYSYFDSKNALYDAMFAQGYEQLLEAVDAIELAGDPRAAAPGDGAGVRRRSRLEDVGAGAAAVPAHAARLRAVGRVVRARDPVPRRARRRRARGRGLRPARRISTCTPRSTGGLVNQQLANDPGGTRWMRAGGRGDGHVPGARGSTGRQDAMTTTTAIDARDDRPDRPRRGDADHRRSSSTGCSPRCASSTPTTGRSRPINTEWDVRAMMLHLLGAAEANASFRENAQPDARGASACSRRSAATTGSTASTRSRSATAATLTNDEVIERFAAVIPKARAGAESGPAAGARRCPWSTSASRSAASRSATCMDMVYTRDVWMHRVDIARATGRPLTLTPEHDGRIVADIVAEWATLYGHAFELELDGPAGGTFIAGHRRRDDLEIDAVEFVCVLSGRGTGTGLLRTRSAALNRRTLRPRTETTMETTTTEIADGIHRISTFVPDAGHALQPVPRRRRRAAAVPHRAPRSCSRWCRRRSAGSSRSSRCAGSRSVTSRRTSAGR